MGMSSPQGLGEPVSEINVTPMVDVLLSLLIIFMVATPKPSNEKLPLAIPRDTIVQQVNDPNASLLISIDVDGSARLGKIELAQDYDAMVQQIKANEKVQADGKLVLQADPKVQYGAVIRVMAAAHEAGVPEVGVASDRL